MVFYRIKQFYWSLKAKIEKEDIEFLNEYLNSEEYILFKRLSICEQKHSIDVAKKIEKICDGKNSQLVKVGFLHDIGKITKKLTVIDKSIFVLLDQFTKGKLRVLKRVEKINVYYNHGKIGASILKSYGYNERILFLVENHHNLDMKDDIELNILRDSDNNS